MRIAKITNRYDLQLALIICINCLCKNNNQPYSFVWVLKNNNNNDNIFCILHVFLDSLCI